MPLVQPYRPQQYLFGQDLARQSVSPITAAAHQLQPEEREGILAGAMNRTLGGLQWFGESLDKAFGARTVRGILYDGPDWGDFAHLIPFSDTLGITDPSEVVYGRDLLEKHGLLRKNTPGLDWGDVAGFATDVFLDPAWLLSGPLKAVAGGATKLAHPLQYAAGKIPALGRLGIKASDNLLRPAGRIGGNVADKGADKILQNVGQAHGKTFKEAYRSGELIEKLGPHQRYAVQQGGQGLLGIHKPVLKYYEIPFTGGKKLPIPLPGVSDDPWILFGSGVQNAELFSSAVSYNPLMRMWRRLREPHLSGVPIFGGKSGKLGGRLGFEAADIEHANQLFLGREVGKTIGNVHSKMVPLLKAAADKDLSPELVSDMLRSAVEGAWNLRGPLNEEQTRDMVMEALSRTITTGDGSKTTLLNQLADQYAKMLGKKGFTPDMVFDLGRDDDYWRGVAATIIANTSRGQPSTEAIRDAIIAGHMASTAMQNAHKLSGVPAQVYEQATHVVEDFRIKRLHDINEAYPTLSEPYRKHLNQYVVSPKDETGEVWDLFRMTDDGPEMVLPNTTEAGAIHEMQRLQGDEWNKLAEKLKLPKSVGGTFDAVRLVDDLRSQMTAPGVARVADDIPLAQQVGSAVPPGTTPPPIHHFKVHKQHGYTWLKVDGLRDQVQEAFTASGVVDETLLKSGIGQNLVETGWLPIRKDMTDVLGLKNAEVISDFGTDAFLLKDAERVFNGLRQAARPKVTAEGVEFFADDTTAKTLQQLGKDVLGIPALSNAAAGRIKLAWQDIPQSLWDHFGQAYKWVDADRLSNITFAKNMVPAEYMGYKGFFAKMPDGPLQASTSIADSYSILGSLVPSLVHGLSRVSPEIRRMVLDAVGDPTITSVHQLTGQHYKKLNEDFLRFLKKYSEPGQQANFGQLTSELHTLAAGLEAPGTLSDEADKLFRNLFIDAETPAQEFLNKVAVTGLPEFQPVAAALPNAFQMAKAALADAGIKMAGLEDKWINYFFRQRNPRVDEILSLATGKAAKDAQKQFKSLFETASRFQRKDILRHVPGGTVGGINRAVKDLAISGVDNLNPELASHRAFLEGKPVVELRTPEGFVRYEAVPDNAIVQALPGDQLNPELLGRWNIAVRGGETATYRHPPKAITDLTARAAYLSEMYGVPVRQAKGLAKWLGKLPRAIAESGVDFFGGGNPISDLSNYLQQNIRSYAAAMTGKNLLLEAIRLQHGGELPQFGILHPEGRTPILPEGRLGKFQAVEETEELLGALRGRPFVSSNVAATLTPQRIAESVARTGSREQIKEIAGVSIREPEATVKLHDAWVKAGYDENAFNEFLEFANREAFASDKMPALQVPTVTKDTEIPAWAAEELHRLLRVYHDPKAADDVAHVLMGPLNKLMTLYKSHFTIAGPFAAFHTRNGMGGLWLNWVTMGAKGVAEGLKATMEMLLGGLFSKDPAKQRRSAELFSTLQKSGGVDEGTHRAADIFSKSSQTHLQHSSVSDYVWEPFRRMKRHIQEGLHTGGVLRSQGLPGARLASLGPALHTANPLAIRGVWSMEHSQFFFAALGESLYRLVEVLNRSTQFYGRKAMGYSDEAAAKWTQATHFDYSKMTSFDKTMRRIVPFWGWIRNNLPLQFELLLNDPGGKSAQTIRAISTLHRESDDEWKPAWMRETFSVPAGVDEEGNRGFYTAWNALPVQDLGSQFVFPGSLADVPAALRRTGEKTISTLHPGIRFPLEHVFGRDVFHGQSLEETQGKWLSRLSGSQTLERAVQASPASRWINTIDDMTDSRTGMLAKLMNMFLAVKYRKVNEADVPQWMRSDLEKLYREVAKDNPWIRTHTTVWVAPEDIQNLSPKVLQELAALRSLAGEVRKRQDEERKSTQRRLLVRRG